MTSTLRHVVARNAPGNLSYTNLPVFYDVDDYQRSIDKTVDYLSKKEEVVTVFQIGEVSEPGISDIDLIVVLDNETSELSTPYRHIFDARDNYLFMHGIFAMPASIYQRLEWLIPIFDSRRLVGPPIRTVVTLDETERETIETTYALEFLFVNLFNVIRQLMARQLKVRNLLCALKALGYDFRLLHGELPEPMRRFNDRIRALRTTAFDRDAAWRDELYDTCILAAELIMDVLEHLAGVYSTDPQAMTDRSHLRVGHNSYLFRGQSDHARSGLQVTTTVFFDWVSGLQALPLPARIANQLRDLQQGLYGTVVEVSPNVFDRLNGSSRLIRRRNEVLAEYHRSMSRVHADFGVYDTFRDPLRETRKWKLIRSLNQQIIRPSSRRMNHRSSGVTSIVP